MLISMRGIDENSPLLVLGSSGNASHSPSCDGGQQEQRRYDYVDADDLCVEQRKNRGIFLWTIIVLSSAAACLWMAACLFAESYDGRSAALVRSSVLVEESSFSESSNRDDHYDREEKSSANHNRKIKSPYREVQTLSFQIYTGGAPAYITDEVTGEREHNPECVGLNSYGLTEGGSDEDLKCYLGLQDTAADINQRLTLMADAVDRAYDLSKKDDSILKIFLAPEFFFRGVNGAFEYHANETIGECSEICHILKGLENIVAKKQFENWIFLFGTIIASEALPTEDSFDYQFYNFSPLYKGYDPATSNGTRGKNFIVPKRYVSNIDFLTPMRDMTNQTMVMELLDSEDSQQQQQQDQQQIHQLLDKTLMNPHARGIKRYGSHMWFEYKNELSSLGYTMIEYGWFYMDGISFSVEICLDHLVHRALMTYMADVVTGSKTRIPSSANDVLEWVGIPKEQAQISLVSSAGMGVVVSSLALRNGGYIFLQDGMEGDLKPHSTFGQDTCQPNELEFFGGSQSVQRTAVISATDVTFKYEMNLDLKDYDLYPKGKARTHWRDRLKGLFSSVAYPPRITVYDPVTITMM